MTYTDGMYFKSMHAADEWLDFECDDHEAELAFYNENDRYEEWHRWRNFWIQCGI